MARAAKTAEISEDDITAKFERIHTLHQQMLPRTGDEKALTHAYLRRRSLYGMADGDHSAEIAELTSELRRLAGSVA